jgi:chromosome segregation ATPase
MQQERKNMIRRQPGEVFFLVVVIIFLFLGCSLKHRPQTGEEFSRETVRLETLIQEAEDPSDRAKLHHQLAELSTHHQNPERNYGKALREFEAYLSLAPVEARTDEAQNWLGALRELDRAEKEIVQLTEKLENLVGENREKREALDRQGRLLDLEGKKNEELQASLEKMKVRQEEMEWANRNLSEANRNLSEANRNLSEANRSLRESTERIKRTMERLKNLDLQMEEKRKAIK